MKPNVISVIGSGSWGTALAVALSENHKVLLWSREEKKAKVIEEANENKNYLPGISLDKIEITCDLKKAVEESLFLVIAVPLKYVREILKKIKKLTSKAHILISVIKGIEQDTFQFASEVIDKVVPIKKSIVVLSGPSHAEELAKKMPTIVVASGNNQKDTELIQKLFTTNYLRIYTNMDTVGVEIGGALKNVISIASGIATGLGFGINTTSAIITRGCVEICRLGLHLGAKEKTFFGLTGVGDLIATCHSRYSRNNFVGREIATGKTISTIEGSMKMVAEGVGTTKAVFNYISKYQIDMPITECVYKILFENLNTRQAFNEIMSRLPKEEFD